MRENVVKVVSYSWKGRLVDGYKRLRGHFHLLETKWMSELLEKETKTYLVSQSPDCALSMPDHPQRLLRSGASFKVQVWTVAKNWYRTTRSERFPFGQLMDVAQKVMSGQIPLRVPIRPPARCQDKVLILTQNYWYSTQPWICWRLRAVSPRREESEFCTSSAGGTCEKSSIEELSLECAERDARPLRLCLKAWRPSRCPSVNQILEGSRGMAVPSQVFRINHAFTFRYSIQCGTKKNHLYIPNSTHDNFKLLLRVKT